jgi:hypothetical protein
MSCPKISIQTKGVKIMTKRVKTYNRYSICFKEKVVALEILIEKANHHYETDLKKKLDGNSESGTYGTRI